MQIRLSSTASYNADTTSPSWSQYSTNLRRIEALFGLANTKYTSCEFNLLGRQVGKY